MRGFAVTLDAVVALSFFMLAMVIIASQGYQHTAPGSTYLKQLTLDVMTVLEKTGRIDQALDGNVTGIQEILEATPKLACMKVSVINSTGGVLAEAVKSDCAETAGLDMQTAARPVLHGVGVYVLKSESWFRKEPE